MKSIRLLPLALLALCLAACNHSDHVGRIHFDGGEVGFDHKTVVIRTRHHERAEIGADGSLEVDGAPVKLNPAGQAALGRYNAAANGFIHQAVKLGMGAADFALDSIGNMLVGLLNGQADQAGKEVERGGKRIEQEALDLCQGLKDWHSAQEAAAQAVPEFRPYAVISDRDAEKDCNVNDSGDGKGARDDDDKDDQDDKASDQKQDPDKKKNDYKADPAKGQQAT